MFVRLFLLILRVHFPVFAGRASCTFMKELIESCGGLESGFKGALCYGKAFIFKKVDCVLHADSGKIRRKTHLRVFVEKF